MALIRTLKPWREQRFHAQKAEGSLEAIGVDPSATPLPQQQHKQTIFAMLTAQRKNTTECDELRRQRVKNRLRRASALTRQSSISQEAAQPS